MTETNNLFLLRAYADLDSINFVLSLVELLRNLWLKICGDKRQLGKYVLLLEFIHKPFAPLFKKLVNANNQSCPIRMSIDSYISRWTTNKLGWREVLNVHESGVRSDVESITFRLQLWMHATQPANNESIRSVLFYSSRFILIKDELTSELQIFENGRSVVQCFAISTSHKAKQVQQQALG